MRKSLFLAAAVMYVLHAMCPTGSLAESGAKLVIGANKTTKRTVMVSIGDSETESGDKLRDALSGITDAGETNPYVVRIEPGIYDVGDTLLQTKEWVDLEGSGQSTTRIKGNMDSSTYGVIRCTNGNVEIRFLTVENTGEGTDAVAISVGGGDSTLKITHVTAIASGSVKNTGIYAANSSLVMNNVQASASGGASAATAFTPTARVSSILRQ